MPDVNQPYPLTAIVCERVQQDQYGSLSIINVLEELLVGTDDPNAPEQMPIFRLEATLVVAFAAGPARGRHDIRVTPRAPSGATLEAVPYPVEFRQDDQRVTFISNFALDMTESGLYWFDVFLDDALITRIPLHVRYERGYQSPWINLG